MIPVFCTCTNTLLHVGLLLLCYLYFLVFHAAVDAAIVVAPVAVVVAVVVAAVVL